MKTNTYHVAAVVHIGYRTDVDTGAADPETDINYIAVQFYEGRIRVPVELCGDDLLACFCKGEIENRVFKRLSTSNENYGIVGLKRWYPYVSSISIQPSACQEEEGEEE